MKGKKSFDKYIDKFVNYIFLCLSLTVFCNVQRSEICVIMLLT